MKITFINGNGIKLLAAVLMLTDHIGMFFFPQLEWLRWIGRISLPLFAFMLAEGCAHTRDKVSHFLLLALVAAICQIAMFIATGALSMCILVTFCFSELIIFSLDYFKRCLFGGRKPFCTFLAAAGFVGMVFLTFLICSVKEIDGIAFSVEYGFWGCMLPAFAAMFDLKDLNLGISEAALRAAKLASFAAGLIFLCAFHSNAAEWFSLISLPVLALYSGERGKLRLKYFFYIFYPAHLALFYLLSLAVF